MQIFHTIILPSGLVHSTFQELRTHRNTIWKTIQIFHTTKTPEPSCLVSIPRIVRTATTGIGPQLHLTIEQPIKKYWLPLFLISFHYGAACTDTACLVWGLLLRCGGWPTLGWVAICQGFIRHLHNSITPVLLALVWDGFTEHVCSSF